MSHTCKAVLIQCMDFRFMKGIREYLDNEGLTNKCDLVSMAGAGRCLADPMAPEHKSCLETQIKLSKDLHSIEDVIIMNHLDCGAYGGRSSFSSDEEEYERHVNDLNAAALHVRGLCPDVNVRLIIASLKEDGGVNFETV